MDKLNGIYAYIHFFLYICLAYFSLFFPYSSALHCDTQYVHYFVLRVTLSYIQQRIVLEILTIFSSIYHRMLWFYQRLLSSAFFRISPVETKKTYVGGCCPLLNLVNFFVGQLKDQRKSHTAEFSVKPVKPPFSLSILRSSTDCGGSTVQSILCAFSSLSLVPIHFS